MFHLTAISPKTGKPVTYTGVWADGRYPHMYAYLDTGTAVLSIPWDALCCDAGHKGCEDEFHSEAYHSADCSCGLTEATCTES